MLIVQHHVVSPSYFLDEMQCYELPLYIDTIENLDRSGYEQARFIAYVIAQSNSKKTLKPTDLMTFSWDEDGNEHKTEITTEEINKLSALSKQIGKKLTIQKQ